MAGRQSRRAVLLFIRQLGLASHRRSSLASNVERLLSGKLIDRSQSEAALQHFAAYARFWSIPEVHCGSTDETATACTADAE